MPRSATRPPPMRLLRARLTSSNSRPGLQRIAGVPMEPRAATGTFDPETGRYTLYAGIGGAVRPKQELAKILGIAEDKVWVVMHEVGGNFGTRGSLDRKSTRL